MIRTSELVHVSPEASNNHELPVTVVRKQNVLMSNLVSQIVNLTRGNVPPPGKFKLEIGKSIIRFFQRFEWYCESKFTPETKELWTGELGTFFEGELLDGFQAYGGIEN